MWRRRDSRCMSPGAARSILEPMQRWIASLPAASLIHAFRVPALGMLSQFAAGGRPYLVWRSDSRSDSDRLLARYYGGGVIGTVRRISMRPVR